MGTDVAEAPCEAHSSAPERPVGWAPGGGLGRDRGRLSPTLGGRSVVHVTQPDSVIGDVWFYAKDDTLYGVQAGSPDAATRLLALLP